MTAPVLQCFGLTRRFGDVVAVNDVSLALHGGALHALVGPPGAGKSTLLNLLAGELAPTSGALQLAGESVTGWPAWRLARAGVGRSLQRGTVMRALSVQENVRLAAQARLTPPTRLWRNAAKEAAPQIAARAALERVGLGAEAARKAGALDDGQLRLLTIAMALATAPRVLLLDEPLAGMGPEDGETVAALLRDLGRDHAVLLVEHDLDVVFSLADQVTVLVAGRVLLSGAPAAVQASAVVRDAFAPPPR